MTYISQFVFGLLPEETQLLFDHVGTALFYEKFRLLAR